ncbi:hypothetical protein DL95DRAFT_413913 [Leptodontidium sp. 2 PMI_412]|nr:hypothetical protein DL95DRAFT_413913 [Leptodontidium sp. 2 PMI_412]
MRFQTIIICLVTAGSSPLSLPHPQALIDALTDREALLLPTIDDLAVVSTKRDEEVSLSSLDATLHEAGNDYGKIGDGNGRNRNQGGKGNRGNIGKRGKGKCYGDAFPEVYNDIAIKSRASVDEKADVETMKREESEDTSPDKLQIDTPLWGYCRRGLDVVDTTGLCCKRGLDSIGACCHGWY